MSKKNKRKTNKSNYNYKNIPGTDPSQERTGCGNNKRVILWKDPRIENEIMAKCPNLQCIVSVLINGHHIRAAKLLSGGADLKNMRKTSQKSVSAWTIKLGRKYRVELKVYEDKVIVSRYASDSAKRKKKSKSS